MKNVLGYRGGLIHRVTVLFPFAAWRHRHVATVYTAVVEWTECTHRHTHTDRQKWKQYICQFYSIHLVDIVNLLY